MNSQREVIYKRRRHALYGERLQVDIVNMVYDTCSNLVQENKINEDYNNFEFELIRFSSTSSPFSEIEFKEKSVEELTDTLFDVVYKHYQNKIERNAAATYPVIKDVFEKQATQYERIVVPFTDGVKTIQVVTNLKNAYESKGKVLVQDFEKNVSLAIIDDTWKDHLRQMDELKQSVRNAQYEQKDPLLIYKFESFELFNKMLNKVNKEVLSFLFKGDLPTRNPSEVSQARERKRENVQLTKEDYADGAQTNTNQLQERKPVETFVRTERKIGRNDRVTIKNVMSGENKEVKYKQAIPLIDKGEWVLTEN
jgi:preprotein translocase subunit SecA